MQELLFVQGYKNDETLRRSFFELAADTFGLNFEDWYQKGCWGEGYVPFSFVEGDRIVANVSVNLLELIMNGEPKKAIQIGTVMTHPDYRKKGLSARLMNKVLEEYENRYDFMYLFANDTVLDFYPKFGFQPVEEQLFSMDIQPGSSEPSGIRKLEIGRADDLNLIRTFASERLPVSRRFAADSAQGILMYYCLNVFNDDLYYLENENAIAIYQKENGRMDLFDLILIDEAPIPDLLTRVAGTDVSTITFHYTPDDPNLPLQSNPCNDGLFVKTNGGKRLPRRRKTPDHLYRLMIA